MDITIDFKTSNYEYVSTFILDSQSGNIVGTIEGSVGNDNQFFSVVKINQEYRNKGIGYQAFKGLYEYLSKFYSIQSIAGSWHKDEEFSYLEEGKSTNLLTFQKGLTAGLSVEDSARNTPTGRWASKLGFTNVKVLKSNSHEVYALFLSNVPEKEE